MVNRANYKAYWPRPSPYPLNERKVKDLMARRGLSGGDLARMLRSTQPTVWRTVTGKTRNPRLQRAIARALGVPLKEILAAPAEGRGGRTDVV